MATFCQALSLEKRFRLCKINPVAFTGQDTTTLLPAAEISSALYGFTVTVNMRMNVFCPALRTPPSSWTVTVMTAVPVAPAAGVKCKLALMFGLVDGALGWGTQEGCVDA